MAAVRDHFCANRAGTTFPLAAAFAILIAVSALASGSEPAIRWESTEKNSLDLLVEDARVATFALGDARIRRPYFANVIGPHRVPVTRHFPPVPGVDLVDHDTMHPGIWLAFSDIDGHDFWRNIATVKTEIVSKESNSESAQLVFRNQYCALAQEKAICEELCTVRWIIRPDQYLILWDSALTSDSPFTFGDQEEMGLGVRLATPLRSSQSAEDVPRAGNGIIIDAAGRRGEKRVWGTSSDWCSYSGTVDGRHVGAVLIPHPGNFRPSSFHVRGTGFAAANPFGQKVFGRSKDGAVRVEPGEQMRLRFGLLLYVSEVERTDLRRELENYVAAAAE